jgi:hypothetical protein
MVGIRIHPGICILALYIPPLIAMSDRFALTKFLIECIDEMLLNYPTHNIIICGDLNRFPVNDICANLDLKSLYDGPTYGNSQLDYILVSSELKAEYKASLELPIDNSKLYHSSILATPATHDNPNRITVQKIVYDMRPTNISFFLSLLQLTDWSYLHNPAVNIDSKCAYFDFALNLAFSMSIPSSVVTMSVRDKPWMTPFLKSLIEKRWAAFRKRDFPKFNHYKEEVKKQITKAKRMWIMKKQNTNIWELVQSSSGKKKNSGIKEILSSFPTLKAAADVINQTFLQNYQQSNLATVLFPRGGGSLHISESVVFNQLLKLKGNKATPDIPVVMYKAAAHILCEPLSLLGEFGVGVSVGVSVNSSNLNSVLTPGVNPRC